MELIAFMIVGYVEISPGECQIDYLRYDKIDSLVLPCHNAGISKASVEVVPSIKYIKQ